MTIRELIEKLNEIQKDLGEEAEVRLMTQRNWPFENTIHGLTTSIDLIEPYAEDECQFEHEVEATDTGEPVEKVVYIVEGTQLGYGMKNAWNICS